MRLYSTGWTGTGQRVSYQPDIGGMTHQTLEKANLAMLFRGRSPQGRGVQCLRGETSLQGQAVRSETKPFSGSLLPPGQEDMQL